ncbi:MAG: RNA 2'-phosphotransferase [Planctomycetota bacterium]
MDMTPDEIKRISKSISKTLRHKPERIGITLDSNGWASVRQLLEAYGDAGMVITRETLDHVVQRNDKQRFEFNEDRTRIRARQGHSINVDLGYEPAEPPDVLYHGTAARNIDAITEKGLLKMNRHHVHLSTNKETMLAVGQRHGKPVILEVDAKQMREDGFTFYVTANDVWLVDHVPPKYLINIG